MGKIRSGGQSKGQASFWTQSRVAAFIHHAAFGGDFLKEGVSFMEPLAEEDRIPHDDVHRKAGGDFLMDFLGGLHPVASRLGHDDEQVHIGVRCGFAIGVGAEEDDPLRLEGGGDVGAVAPDVLHGNHDRSKCGEPGPGNLFL